MNADAFFRRVAAALAIVLAASAGAQDEPKKPEIERLRSDEVEDLMAQRLQGDVSGRFRPFARRFALKTGRELGTGVMLVTSDDELADAELRECFPAFYSPTCREVLDEVALQTSSTWSYDSSNRFLKSAPGIRGSRVAFFEFTKSTPKTFFSMKTASGWKAVPRGNQVTYIPPTSPVGLEVFRQGRYSFSKDTAQNLKRVQETVALERAQRVKRGADLTQMTTAWVGTYEALFFTASTSFKLGGEATWRQWVFTADNSCFLIASTLEKENDENLLADVERMLATFSVE